MGNAPNRSLGARNGEWQGTLISDAHLLFFVGFDAHFLFFCWQGVIFYY